MESFRGKVAVITGGASGIGFALAQALLSRGARIVVADVQADALDEASRLLDGGKNLLAVRTDVSDAADVQRLADRVYGAFGNVDILFNNAGVSRSEGNVWDASDADWHWIIGVNLHGVANGIRAFVPRMLAAGTEGHVVNTASIMGVTSSAGPTIYGVSKHAVVALSEALNAQLRAAGAPIGVSVLCPALVATRIISAERNRPEQRAPDAASIALTEERERRFAAEGQRPADVAELTLAAIAGGSFYIFTHAGSERRVRSRMEAILAGSAPEAIGQVVSPVSPASSERKTR